MIGCSCGMLGIGRKGFSAKGMSAALNAVRIASLSVAGALGLGWKITPLGKLPLIICDGTTETDKPARSIAVIIRSAKFVVSASEKWNTVIFPGAPLRARV